MVQHGWHHSTRPTGGRRDDDAARGILFRDGQGVGIHQATALQGMGVARGLDVVGGGLAAQVERSGKDTFGLDAPLDSRLHHPPNLQHVVLNLFLVLVFVDIFPIGAACAFAPVEDVGHCRKRVDLRRLVGFAFFGQVASANAKHLPVAEKVFLCVKSLEQHAVRVKGKDDFGFPDDFGGRLKGVEDGLVGHVALARGGEAAIERHLKRGGVGETVIEDMGCLLWPHGVAA